MMQGWRLTIACGSILIGLLIGPLFLAMEIGAQLTFLDPTDLIPNDGQSIAILSLENLTLSDESPLEGTNITISVEVWNFQQLPFSNLTVHFLLNTDIIDSKENVTVLRNSSTELVTHHVTQQGFYQVSVLLIFPGLEQPIDTAIGNLSVRSKPVGDAIQPLVGILSVFLTMFVVIAVPVLIFVAAKPV